MIAGNYRERRRRRWKGKKGLEEGGAEVEIDREIDGLIDRQRDRTKEKG